MKYLLDTHILLWAVEDNPKLSSKARAIIADDSNDLVFSVVSIWEVAIKLGTHKVDFNFNPATLRRVLLDAGYIEMSILGHHVPYVYELPSIHKDPFDRLLIATAKLEGMILLTVDSAVLQYGSNIMSVA